MDDNYTCNCKHNSNSRDNEPCCRCDNRKTNADRIRNMSDDELAEWLTNMCDIERHEEPFKSIYNLDTEQEEEIHDSYGDLLKWLQSEARIGENMKKSTAETIAYAIKKECQRSSLYDWCDSWDITIDEFEEFLALAVDNAEIEESEEK